MLRRSCALALALLTLSACDSGEPDGPATLDGSWTIQTSTIETYVTVNRAQRLVDRERPQTGTLQITGAQTGTLRYMDVNLLQLEVFLKSYDPAGPVPAERVEALLQGGYASILFYDATGAFTRYETETPDSRPYTYADGLLTVRPLVLRSATGTTVMLTGGTLAYQTTPLPAGTRTFAGRRRNVFRSPDRGMTGTIRYLFEEAGVFRTEDDLASGQTETTVGTWATAGSQLTLTAPQRTLGLQTFQYAITGGTLRLSATYDACERDTERCLFYKEVELGLGQGSITTVEETFVETFVRAPAQRGGGA